jgi:hypothetical protein
MTDFAALGSLGSASEYNFSKYTLELSPSSDVPAGDLVVVWVAWTSHYFFGPDGGQTPELSCTDDAGNRYLQLFSTYGTIGSSWQGMYVSQLRNDLTTADTITLKHFGPGAKAASIERFSLDPDRRWAFLRDNRPGTNQHAGTDPAALTISGLDASREYLLLHSLVSYGQAADGFSSWDSDYSQIVGDGTSGHGNGGGAPTPGDQQIRGGYRIVTGLSSDTVDVTASGTTRDTMQAIAALVSIEPDEDFPDFPNTPLIDDFNRANEDPADGGIWDTVGVQPGFGSPRTRVVSNQNAESGSPGAGSGSQWTLEFVETEEDAGEYEEYGTQAVVGDLVMLFGNGNGSASTVDANGVGYRDSAMRALNGATVPIGATIFGSATFNGDLPTDIVGIVWGANANGTKIGMQQLTVELWTIHLFMDFGSGWEWVCAIAPARSPDFRAEGHWGVGFEGDVATRLDDFGGGPLEREAPQIIRRPPDPGGRRIDL